MAKGNANNKINELLRGRNGSDELSVFCLVLALLFLIVNIFVRSIFFTVLSLVLIGYSAWRMFSRNLEARENENAVFSDFLGPVRPWLRNPARAASEAREYKHFKCPECGKRMRVPRGKGKIRIRCRECGHKFEARS